MIWMASPIRWTDLPETPSDFDISVIVNAHREGLLCVPSIQSACASARHARAARLKVELIVALDCADEVTRDIANDYRRKRLIDSVLNLKVDDLGGARNISVDAARGKWVAFLDADDLWGENWLSAAYRQGENECRATVLHPELNIYFGEHWQIFRHADMDDPQFRISRLAMQNYWTLLLFTRRSLLTTIRYPTTDLKNQIGPEDWSWNSPFDRERRRAQDCNRHDPRHPGKAALSCRPDENGSCDARTVTAVPADSRRTSFASSRSRCCLKPPAVGEADRGEASPSPDGWVRSLSAILRPTSPAGKIDLLQARLIGAA